MDAATHRTLRAANPLLVPAVLRNAAIDALRKLHPRHMVRNPVMFTVEVGSAFTLVLFVHALATGRGDALAGFILAISLWLWFTVFFANFAEAIAEGRGKAQADALRRSRRDVVAVRLAAPSRDAAREEVPAPMLRAGDVVLVEAGAVVPADGDVIDGIASVDESAITGESAPMIRESGGDRSAVTGGTRVLSDWIVVRVSSEPGSSFLERMISMVESATPEDAERDRPRHPPRRAHDRLPPRDRDAAVLGPRGPRLRTRRARRLDDPRRPAGLPHPDHHRRPPLRDRHRRDGPHDPGERHRHLGTRGGGRRRRRRAPARQDGTITLGNRQASAFLPARGVSERELADAAQLASIADETPEGRSIVVLAKERHGIRARHLDPGATFVPFTAQTRMSGVDVGDRALRKGAIDAIARFVASRGSSLPAEVAAIAEDVARRGATPLAVANGDRALGVVELKDVVKGGDP